MDYPESRRRRGVGVLRDEARSVAQLAALEGRRVLHGVATQRLQLGGDALARPRVEPIPFRQERHQRVHRRKLLARGRAHGLVPTAGLQRCELTDLSAIDDV